MNTSDMIYMMIK